MSSKYNEYQSMIDEPMDDMIPMTQEEIKSMQEKKEVKKVKNKTTVKKTETKKTIKPAEVVNIYTPGKILIYKLDIDELKKIEKQAIAYPQTTRVVIYTHITNEQYKLLLTYKYKYKVHTMFSKGGRVTRK